MPQTIPWTREELDRLPDDGNRYEVLDGELYVTPAPSVAHQAIVAWLNAVLTPFVTAHGLGRVHQPRSVIVIGGSQVEPDLMVLPAVAFNDWESAPVPLLVIEVLSRATQRRDLQVKRDFYMKAGIPEYWIVDRYTQSIIRVRPHQVETITAILAWTPTETATLDIAVPALFLETRNSPA